MAMRTFASRAVSALGLRVAPAPAALQLRTFSAKVVDGLKYASSHEWAKVEGATATVGISDFAQSELGDIVFVELPEVGAQVKAGEQFGVVESVKAASDVYSPLSGEVTEVNGEVTQAGALINTDPFGKGWMMKIKLSAPDEAKKLLDAKKYAEHCEAGGH